MFRVIFPELTFRNLSCQFLGNSRHASSRDDFCSQKLLLFKKSRTFLKTVESNFKINQTLKCCGLIKIERAKNIQVKAIERYLFDDKLWTIPGTIYINGSCSVFLWVVSACVSQFSPCKCKFPSILSVWTSTLVRLIHESRDLCFKYKSALSWLRFQTYLKIVDQYSYRWVQYLVWLYQSTSTGS